MASRSAATRSRQQASARQPSHSGYSKHSSGSNRHKLHNPTIPEEYDSEFDSYRPKLGKNHIKKSIRMLEETRRERKFHAKLFFREFALPDNDDLMREEHLKSYMARVMNTPESKLEKEAVELVLQEARKKSQYEDQGVLTKNGAILAVTKYGEYALHCKAIHKLFQDSDISKDGKLQRDELRKMINHYEQTQHRSTDFCSHVVLFVTEHDLDYILRSADENHDGDIDPTEIVRAIGAWEELANVKLRDFEEAKLCKGCVIS